MKDLHYYAFYYRNAHSTDAAREFAELEDFVSQEKIAAGERWRDEWSDVCNDNQGLINQIVQDEWLMLNALDDLERYQVKRQDFDRFADLVCAIRKRIANPCTNKKAIPARPTDQPKP